MKQTHGAGGRVTRGWLATSLIGAGVVLAACGGGSEEAASEERAVALG